MGESRVFWASVVTISMWVVLAVMTIVFMTVSGATSLGSAVFTFLMASLGIGGMATVWSNMPTTAQDGNQTASTQRRKSNRNQRERLARLVDAMDDDQVIELESLLLARQDEMLDYE